MIEPGSTVWNGRAAAEATAAAAGAASAACCGAVEAVCGPSAGRRPSGGAASSGAGGAVAASTGSIWPGLGGSTIGACGLPQGGTAKPGGRSIGLARWRRRLPVPRSAGAGLRSPAWFSGAAPRPGAVAGSICRMATGSPASLPGKKASHAMPSTSVQNTIPAATASAFISTLPPRTPARLWGIASSPPACHR